MLLFGSAVLAACTPTPARISNSRAGAYEAAVATYDDGLAVAWYDTRDGNAEIYLRLLDREGRPAGPERRLTSGPEDSYEPSIDSIGDLFPIAWYDKSASGVLTAKLGLWNRDGSNRWVRTLAAPGRNPVVRSNGRGIFCAWIQAEADGGEAVWGGFWDVEGTAVAAPRRLAPAGKTTWNLNASLGDPSVALVVFDAAASTRANELFLVSVDHVHTRVVRLTSDDGRESKYPDLSMNGSRAALTWYDARDGNTEIYLFTAALDELISSSSEPNVEIDARARRITQTAGESIGAYVAWNGDRVGLAWSDDTPGQHEVYLQSFDARAMPLAPARRVTRNATSSLIPAIRAWRDGFVLAWNEFAPATAEGHAGRSEIALILTDGS